jgi:hypothetical protein
MPTADWTSGTLEKRVDKLAEGAHPEFRCGSIPSLSAAIPYKSSSRDSTVLWVCNAVQLTR